MNTPSEKIRLAVVLALVLLFAGASFATNGTLSGDGSKANPYQISDAKDLVAFAKKVNGGETTAWAKLTKNICLNACGEGESVLKANGNLNGTGSNFTEWTRIGTVDNPYKGTFNGNGYTVRGLYFNSSSINYVGFFGYVGSDGSVTNVGVEDSYFKGNLYVGGIVGYSNSGSVSKVYNMGTVSGTDDVGGVAGRNTGAISNVYNGGVCWWWKSRRRRSWI